MCRISGIGHLIQTYSLEASDVIVSILLYSMCCSQRFRFLIRSATCSIRAKLARVDDDLSGPWEAIVWRNAASKTTRNESRANLALTALHFSVFMAQTCATELCQVLGTIIRISCSAPKPSNPVSRTDTTRRGSRLTLTIICRCLNIL